MIKYIKKTPEYLQSIAAIWLILVALTIFAEVTFRNLGIFLGADQIVQNSVPAIVFLQVPFAIASGTMLETSCAKNPSIVVALSVLKLNLLGFSCLSLVVASQSVITFSFSL